MTRSRSLACAVAVLLALGAPAVALGGESTPERGAAARGQDTTPPKVSLDPYARYKLGSQVETWYAENGSDYYWQADFFLKWSTSDPSGICAQTVAWQGYEEQGGATDPVLGPDTGYYPVAKWKRTFDFSTNAMNWGRIPDRFVVRPKDCAGNVATSNIAVTRFGLSEDTSSDVTYKGRWRVSHFKGFSGGTTHYTTRKGASFRITFTGAGPVALMMEKAPNRGKAAVYVDGHFRKVIDTHARRTRHRVVVWQAIYKPGEHTLRVVNKATPGHPRIDLDGVLLCGGTDQITCPS